MKNLKIGLFLFFYLLFNESTFTNDWNLTHYGGSLETVFFIDVNTGWVAGEWAAVLKTTNAGLNWETQYGGQSNRIQDIYFFNQNSGIATSSLGLNNGKILRTINGGENWIEIYNHPWSLSQICFSTLNKGWISGANGTILTSSNSGESWSLLYSNSQYALRTISVNSTGYGFAAGDDGIVIKTSDNGVNWSNPLLSVTEDIFSIKIFDNSTAYLCGSAGLFMKTTNGGVNWSSYQTMPQVNLLSMHFLNTNTGWLQARTNNLFFTTNSGDNWQNINISTGVNSVFMNGIFFADNLNGWIVCSPSSTRMDSSIIRTTNGGMNWIESLCGIDSEIRSVFFVNENTGYLAGHRFVSKSTNNGNFWFNSIQGSSLYRDVFFINDNIGWAAGGVERGNPQGNMVFSQTINGGTTWVTSFNEDIYNYNQVQFFSAGSGFAVGLNWAPFHGFFKIIGGSETFTSPGKEIYSMSFVNNSTGWISGDGGIIARTSNGGLNWSIANTGTTSDLKSVCFINSTIGFAVGRSAVVIKTTDSGISWTQLDPGINADFNKVLFLNDNVGWILGDEGSMLFTSNSGISWNNQSIPLNTNLKDMFFIGSSTGWIVGENGTIIKTTNGGGVIGINHTENTIPQEYFLHQNFPNPFNPNTVIAFDVPKYSKIKLTMYNIIGNQIKTLIDDYYSPGSYSINVESESLASGVYIYRMSSGTYSETRKMVLLK